MIKFLFTLPWLLFALMPCACSSTPARKPNSGLLFECVSSISSDEFWAVSEQHVLSDKDGLTASLWTLDSEFFEENGQRLLVGIVGVGYGDVGESPHLAKVWASSSTSLELGLNAESSDSDDQLLIKVTRVCNADGNCKPDAQEIVSVRDRVFDACRKSARP